MKIIPLFYRRMTSELRSATEVDGAIGASARGVTATGVGCIALLGLFFIECRKGSASLFGCRRSQQDTGPKLPKAGYCCNTVHCQVPYTCRRWGRCRDRRQARYRGHRQVQCIAHHPGRCIILRLAQCSTHRQVQYTCRRQGLCRHRLRARYKGRRPGLYSARRRVPCIDSLATY